MLRYGLIQCEERMKRNFLRKTVHLSRVPFIRRVDPRDDERFEDRARGHPRASPQDSVAELAVHSLGEMELVPVLIRGRILQDIDQVSQI